MQVRVVASGTGHDPRFHLVPPRPLDGPLFYSTLPVRGRAGAPFVPAGRGRRREPVRGRGGRGRAGDRAIEGEGRGRGARRLAGVEQPLRVAVPRAPAAGERRGCRVGGRPRRRASRGVGIHGLSPRGPWPSSPRRLHDLLRPGGLHGPAGTGSRGEAGAVRRGARALQERRGARRGVAARRPPRARCAAPSDREGDAHGGGRGPRPRRREWERELSASQVAEAFDASRALLLPSASEGLPRIGVESFLRGRGIVGTRAGGIPDLVEDEVSGLLVDLGDTEALAGAIERILTEDGLAAAPRRGRRGGGRAVGLDAGGVRRPGARGRGGRARVKPRLLMVARTRYRLPLPESTERKFAALRERFDLRVLATSADGVARDDGVFRLVGRLPVLDGPLFYLLLPSRVRRLVSEHRPDAVVTQSPYEAALIRHVTRGTRLVVELHGDWRTAPRLYGSPLRRLLAPLTDRVGAYGVRQADAVRTISAFTTGLVRGLGREPDAEFAAFTDLDAFTGERVAGPGGAAPPLRRRPRALQERRGARRGVAAGRGAGLPTPACTWSARARSRRSPRRSPAKASSGSAASRLPRSPPRWIAPGRCSSRRPPRACRGSSSSRSCAAGR